jgi:hypothetical protein
LLAAKSIGDSRGCSGTAAEGIAKLGIAAQLKPKTVLAEPGGAGPRHQAYRNVVRHRQLNGLAKIPVTALHVCTHAPGGFYFEGANPAGAGALPHGEKKTEKAVACSGLFFPNVSMRV